MHAPIHGHSMPDMATFCDWNRLPLPVEFAGVVDYGLDAMLARNASDEELTQGLATLAATPARDFVLSSAEAASRLLTLLRRYPYFDVQPWLTLTGTPSAHYREKLRCLADLHPRCGINLVSYIGDCASVGALQAELRRLDHLCRIAREFSLAIRLRLSQASAASLECLRICLAFASQRNADRLCVCDERSRLSPLGARNLFTSLRRHLPVQGESRVRLEFLAGNGRGLGIANCIAALESGVSYVHGVAADGLEHDQALPLSFLDRFALPAAQRVALKGYRDFIGAAFRDFNRASKNPWTPAEPDELPRDDRPSSHGAIVLREAAAVRLEELHLVFRVSADDWHVRLSIRAGATLLDLGERVHHYVLLLLAREYCHQHQHLVRDKMVKPADIDPLSIGWIEREQLHRMIGDSEGQLNVKLFRAAKQICNALQSAGIAVCRPFATRVGKIRLGWANFTIFKESKLERQVVNWQVMH